MIDLAILVLQEQTDRLALHDCTGRQPITRDEVTINTIAIGCARADDKAIGIRIWSSATPRLEILESPFIIEMLIAGARRNLDKHLYHGSLHPIAHTIEHTQLPPGLIEPRLPPNGLRISRRPCESDIDRSGKLSSKSLALKTPRQGRSATCACSAAAFVDCVLLRRAP